MLFLHADFEEGQQSPAAIVSIGLEDAEERRWLPTKYTELDALLKDGGSDKTVTWGGGRWLHPICPTLALSQIDLFGLFVGEHRHPISLFKFMCVTDALSPVKALRRIFLVAGEDGRLLWRQNNGKARVWYTESFDVAISDVVERRAARWQSSPLSVERPPIDLGIKVTPPTSDTE